MTETTDIREIRRSNVHAPDFRFSWGSIIKVHEINSVAVGSDGYKISIIEFYPWKQKGCSVLTGKPNYTEVLYHGYVNDWDTCESYNSLEKAIVACIAYKREGCNHKADRYFFKMIESENS